MSGIRWSLAILAMVVLGSTSAMAGDGNGKVKREKGDRDPHKHWLKRFDKIDTNDDGQISQAEFIAFREQMRAKRQEHRAKKAENEAAK
jgi:hypothetical protein